jgi:hypothetical protein
MSEKKTDVPYGTLDLLILKTLETMGPMHSYRIARRIEQVAENLLRLNPGRFIRLSYGWNSKAGFARSGESLRLNER